MILRPKSGFVFACVFLDALGIGLIIPVLPRLIGTLSTSQDMQTWWYGAIMVSYGLMQFLSSPLLGALSDKLGRRPVLLVGILGLGLTFAVPVKNVISQSSLAVSRISYSLPADILSANSSFMEAVLPQVFLPISSRESAD